jgi:phosphate transport system substrate-binding protein
MAEFQKTHPYVKFKLNVNGSGQGLRDILAGNVDLAMISEEIPKRKDSLLWIAPVARLGVVPVISAKNPYLKEIMEEGITRDNLIDLFSGRNTKTWSDLSGKPGKDPVKVYIRGDSAGSTGTLARYLWINRKEIKGTPVMGEKELVNQVKDDPLALSYCNFIYAFDPGKKAFLDDLKVVPINLFGKEKLGTNAKLFDSYEHLQRAMWLGRYPCSLIRNLYLVSNGKPRTREMVDFMYWIVTDGQHFVPENGYIELYSGEVQYLVNSMKALIQ